MGIKLYWTNFAKHELHKIFSYYQKNASLKIAKEIVLGIENKTIILKSYPNIGQKEELLKDRSQSFRYLIFKNYKIIYWNNTIKNRIDITDVFDTRQNPVSLMNNK